MSENKDNKLTLINEKTANDYLTHTIEVAKLKNSQKYGTIRLNQRDKSEVVEVKYR